MMQTPPGLMAFETELFMPKYRQMTCGDWELRVGGSLLAHGYWSTAMVVHDLPVLLRGNETWMSMTPMEVESCEVGVRLAKGHVLVHGLGMGWVAAASAARDEVSAVTVVEKDPQVIALHLELDLFSQLPEAARAKLNIVEGDAYDYVPEAPVDMLMPDIWLPLVNDGRVEEVRAMQANAKADAIYFWGQELEIARHAVAAGRAIDAEGIAATIADFGLPLVGMEFDEYPEATAIAAERWMRGRWFEGTKA